MGKARGEGRGRKVEKRKSERVGVCSGGRCAAGASAGKMCHHPERGVTEPSDPGAQRKRCTCPERRGPSTALGMTALFAARVRAGKSHRQTQTWVMRGLSVLVRVCPWLKHRTNAGPDSLGRRRYPRAGGACSSRLQESRGAGTGRAVSGRVATGGGRGGRGMATIGVAGAAQKP